MSNSKVKQDQDKPIDEPDEVVDQSIKKIAIDETVLAAISKQVASQNPMRGGMILGKTQQGVAHIRYFLFDYASKPASGTYTYGGNIGANVTNALEFEGLSDFLGVVHSKPYAMNYLVNDEMTMDLMLTTNPHMHSVINGIVTMGSAAMAKIEPNELKLGAHAKISFFIKERNQKAGRFTNIETYASSNKKYSTMQARITLAAHVNDMVEKFNLSAHGLKVSQQTINDDDYELLLSFYQSDKKEIEISIQVMDTYPSTEPTLKCTVMKSNQPPRILKPAQWKPDEEDAKNFEKLFEDFLTHYCPLP